MSVCFFVLFLLLCFPGPVLSCGVAQNLSACPLSEETVSAIDEAVERAVVDRKTPGAVVLVGHNGRVILEKAYGDRSVEPRVEPMTPDTVFDLASLTKVIATAPSIMLLVQQGRLWLDDPAAKYLPEFSKRGKRKITIRHLLTHYSGLPADLRLPKARRMSPKSIWARICQAKPLAPPGTRFVYSDLGFVVLGKVVERISGESLDVFADENFFVPLKMRSSRFRPPKLDRERIAPTERTRNGDIMRGEVHDPLASMLRGVAGDAGLFSTAQDLSRFCQMLLNQGSLDGATVLAPETVRLMVSPQTAADQENVRAFGWDINSIYSSPKGSYFSPQSYGHTGYTGTSIWIDPAIESYVIILTNRVHPDGKGNVKELRTQIADVVGAALARRSTPQLTEQSR
jgi:serine-type D-Ala-D-Ala carboxypeptidase